MNTPINHFSQDAEKSRQNKNLGFHLIERDYPKMHSHDYWEFFVVLKGVIQHRVSDKIYPMQQYDAWLIPPGCCHSLKKQGETQHLNIMMTTTIFSSVANGISPNLLNNLFQFQNGIKITLSPFEYEHITHYLSILRSDINKNANPYLENLSETFLVICIMENIGRKSLLIDNFYPEWLNEIIIYINDGQHLAVNIEELVKLTNYSYSHLERIFKKYMGQSLNKYLTDVKMRNADELLRHSSKNILSISYDLGFMSVNHFIKIFKSYYGITPLQYRRQKQAVPIK